MISCVTADGIATIHMDDGKANAMNPGFMADFHKALDVAEAARAVVIEGRPGFFSAGLDLRILPALGQKDLEEAIHQFESMIRRVLDFPVPVVAAVTGHALAGGAVLLLACDLAVGVRGSYRVGLTEAAIGIPLPALVLEVGRLRLSPPIHLKALVLGEAFEPEQARIHGFLDELAEPEEVMVVAMQQAEAAARVPTEAYLPTKRLMRQAALETPTGQLAGHIGRVFLSGSLRHGLKPG